MERLDKAERINAKLEAKGKEKKFKFSKSGCETQFKFNSKIKDLWGDDLKVELEKHFKEGLPEKIGGLVKEAEKEIDDQNHSLKIADEFGFLAMKDFIKEDLARNEKEEKKIKALRKDKKEKEEKSGPGGAEVVMPMARAASGKINCYNCQAVGHMARDCVKPSLGGRSKR